MGRQATVELPDPLQDPLQQDAGPAAVAPAPAASADDLLAQLAGAEIDRILADTEEPAKEPEKEEPAASAEPAPVVATESPQAKIAEAPQQTISDQLDALFQTLTETPEDQAAEPQATEEKAEEHIPTAQELDEEIAKGADQLAVPARPVEEPTTPAADASPIETAAAAAVVEPAGVAPAPESPATPASSAAAVAAAIDADAAHTAAVREALGREDESDEQSDDVPAMLKPLVWLNAPFEAIDPRTRDTLGKVAILTMANAVAVLIYVLMFKKH